MPNALKINARVRHKGYGHVEAEVIYIDYKKKEVTLMVDGYAASDDYSFDLFDHTWELINDVAS